MQDAGPTRPASWFIIVMKRYGVYCIIVFLLCSLAATAQTIVADDSDIKTVYPFITVTNNVITSSQRLDSFYKKLSIVKSTGKGVVRIVHIGDSHIQADIFSGTVRNKLQQFFGNAGRGLVFPYQLAKSNAPADISSSSNITWRYNRLAHPEIPINAGSSGFCIKTDTDKNVVINLSVTGTGSFNHLQFFLDSSIVSPAKWDLYTGNKKYPLELKKDNSDT